MCRLLLVAVSGGHSLVAVHGLLNVGFVAVCGVLEHRLVVVAHRISCFMAHGIFGDQGLNSYVPCVGDSCILVILEIIH